MRLLIVILVAITSSSFASEYKGWRRGLEPIIARQFYGGPKEHGNRMLAQTSCSESLAGREWESFRLRAHFVDFDQVDETLKAYVRDDLVPAAVEWFNGALAVRRVSGNLFASRWCQASYTGAGDGFCVQSDGTATCGNINGAAISVPTDFLADLDTVQGDLSTVIQSYTGGIGAPDSDYLLLVTVKDDPTSCGSGGTGTVAFAGACQFDQCDRPILGYANLCPFALNMETEQQRNFNLATVIHEITHALGFNSDQFAFFRTPDGSPRVARGDDGNPQVRISHTCQPGVGIDWTGGDLTYYPPVGLVEAVSERGLVASECPCPIGASAASFSTSQAWSCIDSPRGVCSFHMITPKVVEMTKDYFDCSNPANPGMELENHNPNDSCEILSSHWEARLFHSELMVASTSSDANAWISSISLALLEDSGWYQPDYAFASSMKKGYQWGYKQGCDFLEKECGGIFETTSIDKHQFCQVTDANAENGRQCSLDHTHHALCDASATADPPGSVFDYAVQAASWPRGDYCPAYQDLTSTACSSTSTANDRTPLVGSSFGSKSRCLMGNLMRTDPSDGSFYPNTVKEPTCYEVECTPDKSSYKVFVTISGDVSNGLRQLDGSCTQAGDVLKDAGGEYSEGGNHPQFVQGDVLCESPDIICADLDNRFIGAPNFGRQVSGDVTTSSGDAVTTMSEMFTTTSEIPDVTSTPLSIETTPEPAVSGATRVSTGDDMTTSSDVTTGTNEMFTSSTSNLPDLTSSTSNLPDLTSSTSNPPDLTSSTSNPPDLTSSTSNPPDLTSSTSNPPDLTSIIETTTPEPAVSGTTQIARDFTFILCFSLVLVLF